MTLGITLSIVASILFSSLYLFVGLLDSTSAVDVFAWRIVLLFPIVMILLVLSNDRDNLVSILAKIRTHYSILPLLILSSVLIGVQQWLFLWAPLNGRGLQVSIGYFLLPLTMIFVGRVLYGERLSFFQKLAAALAFIGICNEFSQSFSISWETLVVALGFPLYFVLRKSLSTDNISGFFIDLLLLLPACIWLVLDSHELIQQQGQIFNMVIVGLISAIALICYLMASKFLPMGIFGLLGNVEPVLLVVASLIIGETIDEDQWYTFIPIWLSLCVLTLEGGIAVIKKNFKRHIPS